MKIGSLCKCVFGHGFVRIYTDETCEEWCEELVPGEVVTLLRDSLLNKRNQEIVQILWSHGVGWVEVKYLERVP